MRATVAFIELISYQIIINRKIINYNYKLENIYIIKSYNAKKNYLIIT